MSSSSRQKVAAGSSSSGKRSGDPEWVLEIELKEEHVLGSFIEISRKDCDQLYGGNITKIVPEEGRVIKMSNADRIDEIYSMYLQVEVDGFNGHYTLGRNYTNKGPTPTIIEGLELEEGSIIEFGGLSLTSTEIGLTVKEERPVLEMEFKVLKKVARSK